MKALFFVAILAIAFVCPVLPVEAQYFNTEVYPDGALFFTAGNSYDSPIVSKLDFWAFPGSEISFSVGPKIGPVLLGLGASIGPVNSRQEVIYLNADVYFERRVGPVNWTSYNLYQRGVHHTDDFILSRDWLYFGESRFGLIGHNRKIGGNQWEPHWGPFFQIGQVSVIQSNKLCVAVNLLDTERFWVAWIFGI